MNQSEPITKTDEELGRVLYDTTDWMVIGQRGCLLCFAANLRSALDRADKFTAAGVSVSAISRAPFGNIIIPADQAQRLRNVIAGREKPQQNKQRACAD